MDYKTYDTSQGHGSRRQWRQAFERTMSGEEAIQVVQEAGTGPHAILGVPKNATQEDIKLAFRRLIMEWHPDRNPHRTEEAEKRSKEILAAYTILCDK